MLTASQLLDRQYHDMRAKVLSLAADLDRLERSEGWRNVGTDARLEGLRRCVAILLDDQPGNRAERVQRLLSDPV